MFHIASLKNARVADILSLNESCLYWNLDFTRDPYEWEIPLVGKLTDDLRLVFINSGEKDMQIWAPSPNDIVSSKSFFATLSGDLLRPSFLVQNVWGSVSPPRVKAFSWVATLGKQNTMDVIQHKRPFIALSPSICPLCRNEGESGNHLFLHCDFASMVWRFIQQSFSLHFVMPKKVEDLFHQLGGRGIVHGGRGKMFC